MRKFITLLLVLGMVSTANAALVLHYGGVEVDQIVAAPLDTLTVTVYSDAAIGAQMWVNVEVEPPPLKGPSYSTDGTITGITANAAAGDASTVDPTAWPPEWYLESMGSVGSITVGEWFNVTFDVGTTPFAITIRDNTDDYNLLDSIAIIPEPATIVLLGLGGLLLRRRR